MTGKKTFVLQAFVEKPWAILPSTLSTLEEIVIRHTNGEKLDAQEVQSRIHGATRPPDRRVKSVAVLPLFGSIFPRANLMTEMSGATSAERFSAQFTELLKDPAIDAIILDINSPGGQVGGIPEAANKIFESRGIKPIIAVANHLAASAAYWIGTAADELVVSPSAEVGSIGVFAMHTDWSAALEQDGVKVSFVKAGRYKTAGNPYEPLTDETRAYIQEGVDEVYDQFVSAVARHRGVSVNDVRAGFGEGGLVSARQAVEQGMADRVGTLEETIERLINKNVPLASSNASASENDGGQVPAVDRATIREARVRLAAAATISITGDATMFVRELLKQREEKLARAQALMETADKENRDLTEAERAEFEKIMGAGDANGELGALDAQIEKIQGERGKLKEAAEKKFGVNVDATSKAEKPDGSGTNAMKRADFEKLSPEKQGAYIKGGGKVQD